MASSSSPYPRPHTNRTSTTLRPLSAELSSLSRSDGSASLQVGNTHVLCAIHGPMSPRMSKWEKYDKGVVSVAFSRGLMASAAGSSSSSSSDSDQQNNVDGSKKSSSTSTENDINQTTATPSSVMKSVPIPPPPGLGATERELEYFIRDALSSCILLDRYPRCVIQVVLQIVQADGSVLGTALNCATLALMDAGVAMGGLPVASTCCVVPSIGKEPSSIWLDPTAEEESGEGHAIVVLVTDMASSSSNNQSSNNNNGDGETESNEIITSFTFGSSLKLPGLLSSIESSKLSSAAMVAFMRLAVEQKVQREVQTLWS